MRVKVSTSFQVAASKSMPSLSCSKDSSITFNSAKFMDFIHYKVFVFFFKRNREDINLTLSAYKK